METIASGRAITGRGGVTAAWSEAHLSASSDTLCLTAPLLGDILLTRLDVVGINVRRKLFGCVIEITTGDPSKVIALRTRRKAEQILNSLRHSGFAPEKVDEFGPGTCAECGAVLPVSAERCAACGWTFAGPGG
jgi:hypothetical protein